MIIIECRSFLIIPNNIIIERERERAIEKVSSIVKYNF